MPNTLTKHLAHLGLGLLACIAILSSIDELRGTPLEARVFSNAGDDAYYVLDVARNLADGCGPIAYGDEWTSGFQPLWTIICAGAFTASGTDHLACTLIYGLHLCIWLLIAAQFMALVREIPRDHQPMWVAPFGAFLLLGDTGLNKHLFNGLETGLYTLLWINCVRTVIRENRRSAPLSERGGPLILGIKLGLFMAARNDAVFLSLTLLTSLVLAHPSRAILRRVIVAGTVASLILAPWLVYCIQTWGSPYPQSGLATRVGPYDPSTHMSDVTEPLDTVMQAVYAMTPSIFPSQAGIANADGFIAIGIISFVIGAAILATLISRSCADKPLTRVAVAVAAASMALVVYYGSSSGAVWFFERYFVAIKLPATCLWIVALGTTGARRRPALVASAAIVAVGYISIFNFVRYQDQTRLGPALGHMGTTTVEFLNSEHAHKDVTIGMLESGRLGFALPNVINLDGKTNVAALNAHSEQRFLDYLLESDIDLMCFRTYHLDFLDSDYPKWVEHFQLIETLPSELHIYRRL
ncbi:hypothetical protein N9151_00675 [bacterium]|nr:hypothetical protein [bacterium]